MHMVASNTVSLAMGLDIGEDSPGRAAKRAFDGSREALRRWMNTLVFDHDLNTDEVLTTMASVAARPGFPAARAVR